MVLSVLDILFLFFYILLFLEAVEVFTVGLEVYDYYFEAWRFAHKRDHIFHWFASLQLILEEKLERDVVWCITVKVGFIYSKYMIHLPRDIGDDVWVILFMLAGDHLNEQLLFLAAGLHPQIIQLLFQQPNHQDSFIQERESFNHQTARNEVIVYVNA